MSFFEYIAQNWTEWFFAILSVVLTGLYRCIQRDMAKQKIKNEAIAEGVKSLLRESIVQNYNKYTEREYCPIYAKESIKRAYEAYHKLGGNDVATKLYKSLLDMPEEPEKEDET